MKKHKGFVTGLVMGLCLMLTANLVAATVSQYLLVPAEYPILVDGQVYDEETLPMMNYQGYTYVPLRAVSELLGVDILWNEVLKQVEITRGESDQANPAFRNVMVTGSQGSYQISGEARVYEATIQYEVEDGHIQFIKSFTTASTGAPDWGTFTIEVDIPEEELPGYGVLMLILYEESAEDGSRLHELPVILEDLN